MEVWDILQVMFNIIKLKTFRYLTIPTFVLIQNLYLLDIVVL